MTAPASTLIASLRESLAPGDVGRLLAVGAHALQRGDPVTASAIANHHRSLVAGTHDWSPLLVTGQPARASRHVGTGARLLAAYLAEHPVTVSDLVTLVSQNAEWAGERRQAGSFYTAADVTGYIVAATVMPAVIDAATAAGVEPFDRLDGDRLVTMNADLPAAVADAIAQVPTPAMLAAFGRVLGSLAVLDPTCGSGAFLDSAAAMLDTLASCVGRRRAGLGCREAGPQVPGPWLLHGIDINPVAVEACRFVLALRHAHAGVAGVDAIARRVVHGDAVQHDARDLIRGAATRDGFDVVVGNPPYVRDTPHEPHRSQLQTASCRNLYAYVSERALRAARPGGRVGLVVPVSAVCADALEPLRALWRERAAPVWVSSYDTIPSTLFPGTVQRLSIMLGTVRRRDHRPARPWWHDWHTTSYHKWQAHERPTLFARLRYVPMPQHTLAGSLAKVGSHTELEMLDLVHRHRPAGHLHTRTPRADNRFWYKRRWSYYLLFLDFMPEMFDADGEPREPTEFKQVGVVDDVDYRVLLATYCSSLFHWYFTTYSDNRNVNIRELAAFPFNPPSPGVAAQLCELADELMQALRDSSELRTCTYRSIGTIRNTYFRQAQTRPVLDRIDAVLAAHYGMGGDHLNFLRGFEQAFRNPGAPVSAAAAPR